MTTTKQLSPQTQPEAPDAPRSEKLITVDGRSVSVNFEETRKAFGSSNDAFIEGLVLQIVNTSSRGKTPDEKETAFAASIVSGIHPRDEVEALLASQMAAVHNATMVFAHRLARVETIQQQDSAERAFNKLARTFVAQIEALKRYRSGGEQKMTVEHVHVHPGGQAIVGNVAHGGRDDGKT